MEENRWEINKIGLLNYWWYDEEEFKFSKGRMILRGTNGSGKSITMQSFIPLILDGRKTPERLDPFGNKAKKIEDYVLGYGDEIKEEKVVFEKEYMIEEPDFQNEPYNVYQDDEGVFHIDGPRVERMLGYTNLDSEKGFEFFQKFLKNNGMLDELEALGIEDGDTVEIYGWSFEYYK